jgi:thiol-disulfide isomerase/thioredoxin
MHHSFAMSLFPACLALAAAAPAALAQIAPKSEARVYDEKADAKQQLAAALAKAKKENQRVLIQWGAEWCGWCKWLAGTMQSDAKLRRELQYEYQLVHIDVGKFDKHMDVAKSLGAELKSIPFLTVLDAHGKELVQQQTEPFETEVDGKKGHDATKLLAFLKQHAAKPVAAADVLAAAMATAKQQDKRVFLHFGAPWCGWCHRLEDWAAQPEIAALLAKDFVDVKVDNDRMTGGKEMFEAQRAAAGVKDGGIPWFVFLAADGTLVAHSTGPKGNAGFPYEPDEVAHFVAMLRAARKRLTDDDIAFLRRSLDENRERDQAKRKEEQQKQPPAPKPEKAGEPQRTGGS